MVLQVSMARGTSLDRAAGLDGGADAYLVEPIEPVELIATVRALLRLASREMDNRRLIQQLRRIERQFADATEAAECGLWDWDIVNGKLEWFGVHDRLAGMSPRKFSGQIDEFSEILHPDDRERVRRTLYETMARREERYVDEYRFVYPDGSVHWMLGTGRFIYNEQGPIA
jgi:PAS domain-containing protein